MQKLFKYFVLFLSFSLLCGCSSNKDNKDSEEGSKNKQSETAESGFRHNTRLTDNSVKPQKLDFDYAALGMNKMTMFFNKTMKEQKDRILEVPYPDKSKNELILGKYEIREANVISDDAGSNPYTRWKLYVNDKQSVTVFLTLYGPSGVFTGLSEEKFLDGMSPAGYEGGETYFYNKVAENHAKGLFNTSPSQTGVYNFNRETDLIVETAKRYYNETYSIVDLSYRYGTKPGTYGTNHKGFYRSISLIQQVEDELRFKLEIVYSIDEQNNYANESNRYYEDEKIVALNNSTKGAIEDTLKIYGFDKQYNEFLQKGEDVSEEFKASLK